MPCNRLCWIQTVRSSRTGSYPFPPPHLSSQTAARTFEDIPGPDAHVLNHDRKFVSIFCRSRASRHRTRMRTARGVFQVLLQRTVLVSIRVRYRTALIISRCMERKLESWRILGGWRVRISSLEITVRTGRPLKSSPIANVPPSSTEKCRNQVASPHARSVLR